jgi:hypothetical protein
MSNSIIIEDMELMAAIAWKEYQKWGDGAVVINRTQGKKKVHIEPGVKTILYEAVVYYTPLTSLVTGTPGLISFLENYDPTRMMLILVVESDDRDGHVIYNCQKYFNVNPPQAYERRRMELGDVPKYREN